MNEKALTLLTLLISEGLRHVLVRGGGLERSICLHALAVLKIGSFRCIFLLLDSRSPCNVGFIFVDSYIASNPRYYDTTSNRSLPHVQNISCSEFRNAQVAILPLFVLWSPSAFCFEQHVFSQSSKYFALPAAKGETFEILSDRPSMKSMRSN